MSPVQSMEIFRCGDSVVKKRKRRKVWLMELAFNICDSLLNGLIIKLPVECKI